MIKIGALGQVYLSGKLENGYMLLARSGNQVQEVSDQPVKICDVTTHVARGELLV